MVGKVPKLDPNVGRVRITGVAYTFWDTKRQKWIARAYPVGRAKKTPARLAAQAQFAQVVKLIKQVPAEEAIHAAAMTANSAWLTRDYLMSNAYGKTIEATTPDGMIWKGIRTVYPDIQGALNSIGDNLGSILVRTAAGWQVLIPSADEDGMVLTCHGSAAPPDYQPVPPGGITTIDGSDGIDAVTTGETCDLSLSEIPTATVLANVTGGDAVPLPKTLSEILDLISAVDGVILQRSGGVWNAVAPGADGQLLQTNGVSVEWVDPASAGIGAGTQWQLNIQPASVNAQATAAFGSVVTPQETLLVASCSQVMDYIATGVYQMGIAPWDAVNLKLLAAPTYTTAQTVAASATETPRAFAFATPFQMNAGTTYLVFIVRTDGAATISQNIYFNSAAQYSAGIKISGSNTRFRIANKAPGVSDVWTSEGGTAFNALGLTYVIV